MRRTTNRPGTCWAVFFELNAVNGISATSAWDAHVLVTFRVQPDSDRHLRPGPYRGGHLGYP